MTFDPVPWCVTGAATDAAVGRVLANVASRNSEGINLPGDMKVTQLSVPGGGVQIASGGVIIRNAQSPGESYIGKASTPTSAPISPTGGSARSDLVMAQVIDPDFAPWQPYTTPSQILNGPYILPYVLPGVSGSTTSVGQVVSYSGYALARIDIPAGTSTITNAMITDLRGLAQPRSWRSLGVQVGTDPQTTLDVTQTTFTRFPPPTFSVSVPSWATHADVVASVQTSVSSNAVNADYQVQFGTLTGAVQPFDYNGSLAAFGAESTLFQVFASLDVTSLQGQTVNVFTNARRTFTGVSTGVLAWGAPTQMALDVQFSERTV